MYQVKTITLPRIRVAAIQLRGDYQLTGRAFERLMAVAATTGLLTPDMRLMGVFYDDPASVPGAELRAAACITVPDDWAAPQKLAPQRKAAASCGASGELTEAQIEGGRYARIVHTGPARSSRRPMIGCTRLGCRTAPRSRAICPVSRST
jgi:AraC family transcriptional regulator